MADNDDFTVQDIDAAQGRIQMAADELDEVAGRPPVENHAAGEYIEEAQDKLSAAIADLERAREEKLDGE